MGLRDIPDSWRGEILGRALAVVHTGEKPALDPGLERAFWRRLKQAFWPHPIAWSALAAAWCLVFALQAAGGDPQPIAGAPQPVAYSKDLIKRLQEQRMFLVELSGPADPETQVVPQAPPPRPRSQSRNQLFNT